MVVGKFECHRSYSTDGTNLEAISMEALAELRRADGTIEINVNQIGK